MAVVQITKENFKTLVQESSRPVLLVFWAVWCGPCKMIAPIVEAIAEEREDILVGKVNVDEEMELASAFGIASIPTVILVKDGKVAATSVGYRPKADLEKILDLEYTQKCGAYAPHFLFSFHMTADGLKGFIADVMLHPAGILGGNFLRHPQRHEHLAQDNVPMENLFRNLQTGFR